MQKIKESVMTSKKEILIYADLTNGALHRNLLELSALARTLAVELGGSVSALLILRDRMARAFRRI